MRGEPQLHPTIALRLMRRRSTHSDPFADLTEREHGLVKMEGVPDLSSL